MRTLMVVVWLSLCTAATLASATKRRNLAQVLIAILIFGSYLTLVRGLVASEEIIRPSSWIALGLVGVLALGFSLLVAVGKRAILWVFAWAFAGGTLMALNDILSAAEPTFGQYAFLVGTAAVAFACVQLSLARRQPLGPDGGLFARDAA